MELIEGFGCRDIISIRDNQMENHTGTGRKVWGIWGFVVQGLAWIKTNKRESNGKESYTVGSMGTRVIWA